MGRGDCQEVAGVFFTPDAARTGLASWLLSEQSRATPATLDHIRFLFACQEECAV
jgi:hypothetical protein